MCAHHPLYGREQCRLLLEHLVEADLGGNPSNSKRVAMLVYGLKTEKEFEASNKTARSVLQLAPSIGILPGLAAGTSIGVPLIAAASPWVLLAFPAYIVGKCVKTWLTKDTRKHKFDQRWKIGEDALAKCRVAPDSVICMWKERGSLFLANEDAYLDIMAFRGERYARKSMLPMPPALSSR